MPNDAPNKPQLEPQADPSANALCASTPACATAPSSSPAAPPASANPWSATSPGKAPASPSSTSRTSPPVSWSTPHRRRLSARRSISLRPHRHRGAANRRPSMQCSPFRHHRCAGQQCRQRSAPLHRRVTPEFWDSSMRSNLRPQFFTIQSVLPAMRAAQRGSIINMSSISWMIPSTGVPLYVAAKAAIVGLTRTLAHELGPDNIRVNAVLPGAIATERQRRSGTRLNTKPKSSPARPSSATSFPKTSPASCSFSPPTTPVPSPIRATSSTAAGSDETGQRAGRQESADAWSHASKGPPRTEPQRPRLLYHPGTMA